MKNPITWVDRKLLALTARFTKRFNWLTGKDNFWLARRASFAIAIISIPVLDFSYLPMLTPVFALLILLAAHSCGEIVSTTERIRELEMLHRVKDAKTELLLQNLRLTDIGFFTVNVILVSAGALFTKFVLIYLLGVFCLPLVSYLISIDKPLFSRSKALEWLKGKLHSGAKWLVHKPNPQPVLIPASVQFSPS
ncbi:MAG: hypothetical protein Q7S09_01175 [bacterium]|nr:hypothetical protein [bacterium]